jgi:DNA-directed RNA polymerase specialized sigma subunit
MATTTNKNYYVAHVAPALMQHPTLSLYARTVGISLLMHRNNKTGLCYPEQTTIADELGVSESTVIRALAELQSLSLVDWKRRDGGQNNSYDLAGLLALCSQKLLSAAEVGRAIKAAGRINTKE